MYKRQDKHLVLIDLSNKGLFGKKYARALDYAGIIANMNTMPQEKRPPADPSALRVGTPWITTRGMKEPEMKQIAKWMNEVMEVVKDWQEMDFEEFNTKVANNKDVKRIAKEVNTLCKKYPLEI